MAGVSHPNLTITTNNGSIPVKNEYNLAIPLAMDYQVLSIEQLVEECAERPCADAWEEFIRRFNRLIASVVRRACLEWDETRQEIIDELIQDVYVKLCADDRALLKRFKPQHENAFLGYLKVVTANLVYDYFRKIKHINEKTNQWDDAFAHRQSDKNRGLLENKVFSREVDDLLRARGSGPQQEKERTIFWLVHRWGFTAKEIASVPGMELSEEGVESCLFRMRTYLKQSILAKKAKEKKKGVPAPESL